MPRKWNVTGVDLPELRDRVDDLRAEWEEMSERWQGGEKGEAVSSWLDELESVCDEYDGLIETLDGLTEPSS